jgi:hypothetical protein
MGKSSAHADFLKFVKKNYSFSQLKEKSGIIIRQLPEKVVQRSADGKCR